MKKAMNQSTLTSILNFASIGAIVIAIVACIGVVIVNTKRTETAAMRFDLTKNATRFTDGSAYLTNQVRSYAVTGDLHHHDNYWNEINTLKNRDIGVENMKKIGITADEQAQIEAMSALSNGLVPIEEKAMELTADGELQAASAEVYSEFYDDELAKIQVLKNDLFSMIDTRTQARLDNLQVQAVALWFVTFILIAFIVAFQLISFFVIKKRVIKPVIAIEEQMLEISQGNLSASFTLTPDTSEIGRLINAIHETKRALQGYIGDISSKLTSMADNNMDIKVEMNYIGDFAPIKTALTKIIGSLNYTLSQINISSVQVSNGAEQVSDGAQALSQGAAEQASSIEELSAAINEISEQIRLNAENSSQASQIANQTGEELMQNNQQMQELMTAISNISDKSSEISKIIKTIDDIAFQTNILALNAAVEAARAGVAGKGFAVVADEVRNLSGKSAEAAKNTTALIESSISAVDIGSKIAANTVKSMAATVEMAQGVVAAIQKISAASSEQALSITQVTQGVEQISAVVQTNSATSEESAAASEQLSGQSQRLKDLSGKFKLSSGK